SFVVRRDGDAPHASGSATLEYDPPASPQSSAAVISVDCATRSIGAPPENSFRAQRSIALAGGAGAAPAPPPSALPAARAGAGVDRNAEVLKRVAGIAGVLGALGAASFAGSRPRQTAPDPSATAATPPVKPPPPVVASVDTPKKPDTKKKDDQKKDDDPK